MATTTVSLADVVTRIVVNPWAPEEIAASAAEEEASSAAEAAAASDPLDESASLLVIGILDMVGPQLDDDDEGAEKVRSTISSVSLTVPAARSDAE